MELKLVLNDTNADTFLNWLTGYVDTMNNRYSERGVSLFTEVDSNLDEWMYPEPSGGLPGWIHRAVVLVDLPGGPPDGDLESGYYPFEITPLNHPFYEAGVEVAIKRHPSEEHSQTKAYLMELLRAIAQRWEGIMEQLSVQGLILDNEITGVDKASEHSETEGQEVTGASTSDEETRTIRSSNSNPWDQIPHRKNDREILHLWWKGSTCKDIEKRLAVPWRTVRNILYRLRKKFGDEIVPTDAQLREIWRK